VRRIGGVFDLSPPRQRRDYNKSLILIASGEVGRGIIFAASGNASGNASEAQAREYPRSGVAFVSSSRRRLPRGRAVSSMNDSQDSGRFGTGCSPDTPSRSATGCTTHLLSRVFLFFFFFFFFFLYRLCFFLSRYDPLLVVAGSDFVRGPSMEISPFPGVVFCMRRAGESSRVARYLDIDNYRLANTRPFSLARRRKLAVYKYLSARRYPDSISVELAQVSAILARSSSKCMHCC